MVLTSGGLGFHSGLGCWAVVVCCWLLVLLQGVLGLFVVGRLVGVGFLYRLFCVSLGLWAWVCVGVLVFSRFGWLLGGCCLLLYTGFVGLLFFSRIVLKSGWSSSGVSGGLLVGLGLNGFVSACCWVFWVFWVVGLGCLRLFRVFGWAGVGFFVWA